MTRSERIFCHLYARASSKEEQRDAFRKAFDEPEASNQSVSGRMCRLLRRPDIDGELKREDAAAKQEMELVSKAELDTAIDLALAKKRLHERTILAMQKEVDDILARPADARLTTPQQKTLENALKMAGELGPDTLNVTQVNNVEERARQLADDLRERLTKFSPVPEGPNA